jgi:tripartite-type tricarboxylate transporter receptor subunit TctC
MLDRRRVIALAALAVLASVLGGRAAAAQNSASAERWPSRFVRLVVPFPPGGGTDAIARVVAAKLSDIWGQQVVIENRGGGATNIGTETVVRADADGYTMLLQSMPLAVNRFLFPSLNYDAITDLAPVSLLCEYANIMAVPMSSPANSVADFIANAKTHPGKVTFASSGHGTSVHLSGELFKRMAGIEMLHVPYRGAGPALNDLLGGQLQAMASAPGTLKQHVDEGRLRVLANWGSQRIPSFPDLPTFMELGYKDVEFYIWAGLFVPSATPEPIVARLRDAMREVMTSKEVVGVFEKAGSPAAYQDAPEFAKFIEADSTRLIAAVQKIGKVAEQ